jgi:polygalacturonase
VQYSKDVYVHDMIIFGYRQNSDGIAICDTENALVEDCFIRSGDDLFEVKSLNKASQTGGKHIIFRNCTAWADKCRGFGIIQETKNDIDDVLYENCAMLFKMATWSEELGSLVVVVGDGGTVSNVTFRDMEVYYDAAYAINVSLGPTDWTEGTETGKILNVTFENIRLGNNNKVRIRKAEQLSESDLSGISFKNITLGESKATFDSLQMTYLYTDLTKNNITIE